jgi:outer membrane protein assembly factor BamB
MEFVLASPPGGVRKLWTQQVPGLMTDLSVARDGSAILIATIPNPEGGAGPQETARALTRFDRKGRKVWRIELKGVLKSMALTDDGDIALVSTYDGELLAIDARGKTIWKAEGMCKPVPFKKRFLCYHDDDAEPGVAFDVYGADGRKLLYYPITRDVLALKVSDDQRNVALALDGGQLVLFGPDFQSLWQRKIEGEILDLAVTDGAQPRIAALYNTSPASDRASQAVAVFDKQGKLLGDTVSAVRASQIEAVPGSIGFATYGNGKQGQSVAYYEITEKWRRSYPRAADYTSSLLTASGLVILGFEETTPSARLSHLIAFDPEGALKWNLPLVTQEGAYLYAQGFAPRTSLLAVGTDDGFLSAFQLSDFGRLK